MTGTPLVSRRSFVQVLGAASGMLAIGIDLCLDAAPGAAAGAEAAPWAPNAWLRIHPNDRIDFVLDKTEMGQGVMTALPMILAEELEVDYRALTISFAPAHRSYTKTTALGIQLTGGSASVASSYEPLRAAGAVARQMLVAAAAKTWGVAAGECTAELGTVRHAATGKSARYGELAVAAAALPVPQPILKDPKNFKVIGKSLGRLDNLLKVTGQAGFGIDVQRPEQVVAVVVRCPTLGGRAKSFDMEKARATPGFIDAFEIPTGVAVVAHKYWQARKAADALTVTWDSGKLAGVSSESLYKDYAAKAGTLLASLEKKSDVATALGTATKVVEAEYQLPFLAHAPMEPMNCTAHVTDDGCDIWAPTQAPGLAQQLAVELLGLPHDKVRVHTTFLGGGFGRRLYQDFIGEAVEVARRVKQPVKVQWSRQDDIQHDFYRPATVHRLKGSVDATGNVTAWAHAVIGQSVLAQCMPSWLRAMMPTWLPEGLKSAAGGAVGGTMSLLGKDQTAAEGAENLAYAVTGGLKVEYGIMESLIPVGFWRSVGHSYTGFVVEGFVDELAHAAGKDPVAFRRGLLTDKTRILAVLDRAAKEAGWGTPLPQGVFRGVAQHESFGSFAAQVAEVSVDAGVIKVHRVVCVIDCGRAVNPDIVKAQMEGAIVFGLSAALFGEITLKDGAVVQSNFHDYPVARMTDVPRIEVHVMESDRAPSGAGEPGVPPVAPAIANAVFAATGTRLRKLPLRFEAKG